MQNEYSRAPMPSLLRVMFTNVKSEYKQCRQMSSRVSKPLLREEVVPYR